MTKQEAIDKTWTMLEILEALPAGVDIIVADVKDRADISVQFDSGIEMVAKTLGRPIVARIPEESVYVYREIITKGCEYVQLDKKTAPGVDGTRDGGTAEQSPTEDNPIIDIGKEEVKP